MAGGVELKDGYAVRYLDDRVQQLYDHAIDSIEMGVGDFQMSESDPRRLMSSVRNVDAGLELLCKAHIASTGFGRIVLPGKDGCPNKNLKTIGFKEICEDAKTWDVKIDRVLLLHRYRNDVEHFYPADREVARQHLANAFIWLCEFLKKELLRDPQANFTKATWAVLLNEREIMAQEEEDMINMFSELDLPDFEMTELVPYHFKCPSCRSLIVTVAPGEEQGFLCRRCGRHFTYAELKNAVYPNCICKSCMNPLEDDGDLEVFCRTGMCGYCDYKWSKDD